MDEKANTIRCDGCEYEFNPNNIDLVKVEESIRVNKQKQLVSVLFFKCPECGHEYTGSVMNKSIETKVENLRKMDSELVTLKGKGFRTLQELESYNKKFDRRGKYRQKLIKEQKALRKLYLSTTDVKQGGKQNEKQRY